MVVSDGLQARIGTLTSPWERFAPWRTTDGSKVAPPGTLELTTLLQGVFHKTRLLDLVRGFIVFEDEKVVIKKIAGYHQFHAVSKAVERRSVRPRPDGDRKVGVVWHTQGSARA